MDYHGNALIDAHRKDDSARAIEKHRKISCIDIIFGISAVEYRDRCHTHGLV